MSIRLKKLIQIILTENKISYLGYSNFPSIGYTYIDYDI